MSETARPTPMAESVTSPAHVKGKKVEVDVFHLDEIPGAMDKMGWPVAAKMMRRWFSNSPAYVMPEQLRPGYGVDYKSLPASQIDDQTIKMDWVLSFPRARFAFDRLCREWNNEKGMTVLMRDRLEPIGWEPGATAYVGRDKHTAIDLDFSAQVNRELIGEYSDTFDDLYGAIFKATLKLAVVGKAYHSSQLKKDIFEIQKMGVYVRDTYDFNSGFFTDATAGLGIWSRDRLLSKRETLQFRANQQLPSPVGMLANYAMFNGFVPVHNSDFRDWQRKHRTGGDFFVFSDVKWVQPNVEYIVL